MNTSKTLIYDGSFNGFLTAVFIGFEQRINQADIQRKGQLKTDSSLKRKTFSPMLKRQNEYGTAFKTGVARR